MKYFSASAQRLLLGFLVLSDVGCLRSKAESSDGGLRADTGVDMTTGGAEVQEEVGTAGICGDGHQDTGEQCDLGAGNRADAYGRGQCTTECKTAPFCGDGVINGGERCDAAGSGSTSLGSCNPECSGFYEKKVIRKTNGSYKTNLGGIAGADTICVTEFGSGWKALLVGGTRRATRTPFAADDQQDWVIKKYVHYFNVLDQLVWRTDAVSLLGVRDGMQMNLYADLFALTGSYPWSGYAFDWTTFPDTPASGNGTCKGWTSDGDGGSPDNGYGSFITPDLGNRASELCGGSSFILCVQQ